MGGDDMPGRLLGIGLLLTGLVAADEGIPLRAVSFNIRVGMDFEPGRSWRERRDPVAEVLRAAMPDIIGLQEDLSIQADDVRAALPEYGAVGRGNFLTPGMGALNSILYRKDRCELVDWGVFWLSETPEEPGSLSWGHSFPRSVVWCELLLQPEGRRLRVYNTHLPHAHPEARLRCAAFLQARIAEDRAESGLACIVLGDLNALPGSAPLQALLADDEVLVDAFEVADEAAHGGTYHAFTEQPIYDERIDYLLVSPEFRVLRTEILRESPQGIQPSDHFPVLADLCLCP